MAGDRRATSVQASSKSGMFFWGCSRPVNITRGRGRSSASTELGPGRNRSASTPLAIRMIRPCGDAELAPLPLDLGRDGREAPYWPG